MTPTHAAIEIIAAIVTVLCWIAIARWIRKALDRAGM